MSPSAFAANNYLTNLQKCQKIQEDSDRLACFDTEVSTLSSVARTETRDNSGMGLPKIGDIFKSDPKSGLENDATELTIGLKSTSDFGYKKTRFHLDNGQVWDQIDSARVKISKSKAGELNTVTVRKAALGSFTLRINDSGKKIRVRRVK